MIDSALVNAFALPGGRILLARGMIAFAGDGDALAGVLAHEIGHAAKRHPTARAIEHAGLSLLVGLLVGDVAGGTVLAGLGQAMLGAAYTRDAERAADAVAVDLLNRAGLRGNPFADLLDRAARERPDAAKTLGLLASHPAAAVERVCGPR